MVVTVDTKGLGELVHRSQINYIFSRGQTVLGDSVIDDNGHVNSGVYAPLIEKIRRDIFLPEFGFSDEIFNLMGWQQIRRIGGIKYGVGLIEGERANIELSLFVEPKTYFHMVFDINNSYGKRAALAITNDYWNKKEKGIWIPNRGSIPAFFVDAIRNV